MAKRKIDKGTRVILATAAVVCGLVMGIVVIAVLGGRGGGTPPPYQPFFAGQSDRIMKAGRPPSCKCSGKMSGVFVQGLPRK